MDRKLVNRRDWLRAAGWTFAVASLPGWMAACSSRTKDGEPEPRPNDDPVSVPAPDGSPPRSMRDAIARARERARPLLVLVVPADANLVYERGELFGVYVNHAEGEQAADLALCDLWCAKPDEIHAELGATTNVDDAALAVLVEPDGSPASVIRGQLPSEMKPFGDGWFDEGLRTEDARTRNRAFQALLHAAIAPNADVLRRRAEHERKTLTARAEMRGLGALRDDDELTEARAQHAPAWTRWSGERGGDARRKRAIELLERETARRWGSTPPPRTRWANGSGCGTSIEGAPEEGSMVACGMGFTPKYSSRFLVFYLEDRS